MGNHVWPHPLRRQVCFDVWGSLGPPENCWASCLYWCPDYSQNIRFSQPESLTDAPIVLCPFLEPWPGCESRFPGAGTSEIPDWFFHSWPCIPLSYPNTMLATREFSTNTLEVIASFILGSNPFMPSVVTPGDFCHRHWLRIGYRLGTTPGPGDTQADSPHTPIQADCVNPTAHVTVGTMSPAWEWIQSNISNFAS